MNRLLRHAPTALLVVLAAALYGLYFSYTRPLERNPDAPAHLAYIDFLLKRHALPASTDCAACHHPPLYYLLGATFRGAFEAIGVQQPPRGLQLVSIGLFLVFVGFSAASIGRLVRKPYLRALAIALVAFWPYSVLNSVRVNNDVLLYAISAIALYCLLRWHEIPRKKWLIAASLAAAIGLFVKANALALIVVILVVSGARCLRDRSRARSSAPIWAALVGVALLHGFVRGPRTSAVAANVLGGAYAPSGVELTPRSVRFYATFEPRAFVASAYVETRRFRESEPTFWNHLIKSSLFGTRNVTVADAFQIRKPNPVIAKALNVVLLGMLGFLAVAAWFLRKKLTSALSFSVLVAATYVGSALAFHLFTPAAHHADFRFIFPVVMPLSVLFVEAIEGLRRRKNPLWHAGLGLAHVMVGLSIAYYVPATFQHPSLPSAAGQRIRIGASTRTLPLAGAGKPI